MEARENVSRFEKVKEFTNPLLPPPSSLLLPHHHHHHPTPSPSLSVRSLVTIQRADFSGTVFQEEEEEEEEEEGVTHFLNSPSEEGLSGPTYRKKKKREREREKRRIGGIETAAKVGLFTALVKMCRHQNQKLKQRKNFKHRERERENEVSLTTYIPVC